jgi:hypothetical protein
MFKTIHAAVFWESGVFSVESYRVDKTNHVQITSAWRPVFRSQDVIIFPKKHRLFFFPFVRVSKRQNCFVFVEGKECSLSREELKNRETLPALTAADYSKIAEGVWFGLAKRRKKHDGLAVLQIVLIFIILALTVVKLVKG